MSTWCSKHVETYNKLIMEQEFVHEVGQLLRLVCNLLLWPGITQSVQWNVGARGGAFGWGIALQGGRSRFRFPIVLLALGLTQPLTEMCTRNISWVGKSGRYVGLTPLPASCADCLKIWDPQLLEPSWLVRVCNGIALPVQWAGYGLDGWGFGVVFLAGARGFSLFRNVQTVQPSFKLLSGIFSFK